jgi:hypothetical protein
VTAPVVCWPGFPARRTGRTPRSAVALRSGQAARQFHGTARDEMPALAPVAVAAVTHSLPRMVGDLLTPWPLVEPVSALVGEVADRTEQANPAGCREPLMTIPPRGNWALSNPTWRILSRRYIPRRDSFFGWFFWTTARRNATATPRTGNASDQGEPESQCSAQCGGEIAVSPADGRGQSTVTMAQSISRHACDKLWFVFSG